MGRGVDGGPTGVDRRGQTVVDFAIGAGVLLITIGVVFTFVPSIFEPFVSAGGGAPIGADRGATHLTRMLAADSGSTSALSAACTAAFFDDNETLSDEADCGFDADDSVADLVGVGDDVQVTVVDPGDSPTGGPAVERSFDGETYTLARGDGGTPADVAVANRIVSIEGDRYRLVVEVW